VQKKKLSEKDRVTNSCLLLEKDNTLNLLERDFFCKNNRIFFLVKKIKEFIGGLNEGVIVFFLKKSTSLLLFQNDT